MINQRSLANKITRLFICYIHRADNKGAEETPEFLAHEKEAGLNRYQNEIMFHARVETLTNHVMDIVQAEVEKNTSFLAESMISMADELSVRAVELLSFSRKMTPAEMNQHDGGKPGAERGLEQHRMDRREK